MARANTRVATLPQRSLAPLGLLAMAFSAWALWQGGAGAQERAVEIPAPAADIEAAQGSATAIFAGGCFWGVQGVFQHLDGVTAAVSGYSGGDAGTATYEQTSSGTTGHAEVVQVTYDPSVVSYGELLQVYFSVAHNPTQLDFQGPDRGTQYRSTIFPVDQAQADVAAAYIDQLDATGLFGAPIVTTLEPFDAFYPAEDYHQDFLALNPGHGYIVRHDLPKIEALRELFPEEFRDQPVLVGQS